MASGRGPLPPWAGTLVELPSVVPAVRRALAVPSACVPADTVVLSYVNAHHQQLGLRAMQFERVARLGCLMARVVSVCYGVPPDGFGACVAARQVPASTFRRGAYVELLWAKWRLVHEALGAARGVLFLDTDVVLLRNPFDAISGDAHAYDVRFQTSIACPAVTCDVVPRFEADWSAV